VGNDQLKPDNFTVFEQVVQLSGDHIKKKNKISSIKSNFILNGLRENEFETTRLKAIEEKLAEKIMVKKKEIKNLKDFFPLSEEDCRELQSMLGRYFSLKAMNEILQDIFKKLLLPEFWSKNVLLLIGLKFLLMV